MFLREFIRETFIKSFSLNIFMKEKRKFLDKKGIVSEYLPWVLISIAVLVVLMVAIFVLKGKGLSALDSLKNLFGGI